MPARVNKTVCPQCGSVVVLGSLDVIGQENWLPCVLPTGFEWQLPAGKLTPVVGPAIYVTAVGDHMSREEYLKKFNIDPEIAYQNMRHSKEKISGGNKKPSPEEVQRFNSVRNPVKLGRY